MIAPRSVVDDLDVRRAYTLVTGRPADSPERGGQVRVRCPSAGHADEHPSCDLALAKRAWTCRSCGLSGGILDLPVVAGFARDRADAARWYEEKLGRATTTATKPQHTFATVVGFAAVKRLPMARMQRARVKDVPGGGIRIPILGENGEQTGSARIRRYVETAHPTTWQGDPRIYGEQSLPHARKRRELVVVEGESDTLTLHEQGIPALGVPGATMAKLLEGRHVKHLETVYVVREPGAAGGKFIESVGERLRELRFAGTVRVVDVQNSCGVKDPSDLHVLDPERFRERWAAAAAAATPHVEPAPADPQSLAIEWGDARPWLRLAKDALADDVDEKWGALQELPTAPGRTPSMPIEMVPEPLGPWVSDICARMRVPVEMIAVPAMIALATVVGRNLGIRPKRHDDWLVVPNLWGAIVARPGCLKTPALQEALRPLMRLAHEARQRYEESCKEREPEMNYVKSVIAALEANLKGTLKKGNAGDDLRNEIERKHAEREALATVEKRYLTNDSTTEKLGELLRDNPRGLLVFRDELIGWLRTLDAADRPNDRGFYLECWNGDGRYNCERIGRGSIHIESACVSLLGGVQPGPLREYIAGAIGSGRGADGLLQRLQLTIWPDDFPAWENVDRYPDASAKKRAFEIFKTLDSFEPKAFGAEVDDERRIPALRFAPDAQDLFDGWRDALEKRLRSDEMRDRPAFEAHIAKYRSLMPSLALLFHLVDVAIGVSVDPHVSLRAAALAADWCAYLELHAAKLYGREVPVVGRGLVTHIERGDVPDRMTVRDLGRRGWHRLGTPDDVREAVAELELYGWARIETRPSTRAGGRPSDVVRVHPDLRGRD